MKVAAAPVGTPWLWMLGYGHHEDRTPIYGYEATREAAMAASATAIRPRSIALGRATLGALLGLPVIFPWSSQWHFLGRLIAENLS